MQEINIKEFFEEILSDIDGLKEIRLDKILKEKLAMAAQFIASEVFPEAVGPQITRIFFKPILSF